MLSTEIVTLASNSHIHEFEILPEHAPNIFVSVFLLNPADEDRPFADWRMGTTQLQVDPERYALNIEISAEPDKARATRLKSRFDLKASRTGRAIRWWRRSASR